MSFNELTNKINKLTENFQQFQTNHKSEIEMRNSQQDTYDASKQRPFVDSKSIFVNSEITEHKNAFCSYIRKGNETKLAELEQKALSSASDADGGYLITPYMSEAISKTVFETSPMRQIANVTSISTDSLELIEDTEEAFAGWTSETEVRQDTETPQIGKKVIHIHELYAQPKATQKLVDDSSIDIENWLSEKLVDVFGRKENAAFINGDGVGKPRGILSYDAGTKWGTIEQINSGENGVITATGLIDLFYSLKEAYAVKGKFLMSRAAVQAVRNLRDSATGKYLWQASLQAGTPDTLMGVEVIQAADMPGLSKGSLSVAFGDFKSAYQIVDRQGIRVLRDPFTEKPYVKFYTTKRVGGDVVNFDAIKLLKLSA